MAKGIGKRQANGTAFFPQWFWDHLGVSIGEEYEFQDDTGTHGDFGSLWKYKTK